MANTSWCRAKNYIFFFCKLLILRACVDNLLLAVGRSRLVSRFGNAAHAQSECCIATYSDAGENTQHAVFWWTTKDNRSQHGKKQLPSKNWIIYTNTRKMIPTYTTVNYIHISSQLFLFYSSYQYKCFFITSCIQIIEIINICLLYTSRCV